MIRSPSSQCSLLDHPGSRRRIALQRRRAPSRHSTCARTSPSRRRGFGLDVPVVLEERIAERFAHDLVCRKVEQAVSSRCARMSSSSATRRVAFDTAFAVTHETGRKVACNGIGDSVNTIAAFGRCRRIRPRIASRLSTFSATDESRKPDAQNRTGIPSVHATRPSTRPWADTPAARRSAAGPAGRRRDVLVVPASPLDRRPPRRPGPARASARRHDRRPPCSAAWSRSSASCSHTRPRAACR